MMTPTIKEEGGDRVVLTENVEWEFMGGSALIIVGLYCSWMCFSLIFDASVFGGLLGVLFGGLLLFWGLHILLVREVIIIDKRLQSVVITKESSIKQFESIKKIPFTDLKAVEITRNTSCKNCDYASPVTDSSDSWDVSLITIDGGTVFSYYSDSKSESERIAEKIGAISDKVITHQLKYTPPDYGGGG